MAKISKLDFYAVLGVHPHAEDIVIRAAFKALAQRYHPDRFNGSKDEAHRRMADLTSAYETLADPARRRKYDRRRGLASRTATFYFKNPARDDPPFFGRFAARAALAQQRRYRIAVYALMGVVVLLSAFNIYQHAGKLREYFGPGRAAPAPAVDGGRAGPVAPAPVALDAPASATTANVRILPISQGAPRLIAPAPEDSAAPPLVRASDSPSATEGQISMPPVGAPAPPAAVEGALPVAPQTAPPLAPESTHREAKRPATKAAAARVAPPEAPPVPRSPAPAGEACTDTVAALGLCNRSSTAKGQ
jgi:hypothetical protein